MKLNVTSESLRIEAARYDRAMRAMAGIAAMPLQNADALRSALAVLDREGSNLRFHGSRLVVLGLDDPTFVASVKKASPDRAAGEALISRIRADPQAILGLPGAPLLIMRMRQSREADATTLRSVSRRFQAVGGASASAVPINAAEMLSHAHNVLDLILLVAAIGIIAGVFALASFLDSFAELIRFLTALEACQDAAARKRAECVAAAHSQPIPSQAAEAQCGAGWATQAAQCLLTALRTPGT